MSSSTQYEIKSREATEATIQIAVPYGDVEREIESVYQRYSREVRVPGFRQGHVPRAYLETRFGRDAFVAEAKENLEQQHVPLALTELQLRPVSIPHVSETSFDEAQGFVFDASFSILPDIELPSYKDLEVTIPKTPEVSDEDVERTLHEIQEQFGSLGEKEGGAVSDGDIVRVREKGQEWDTRAESGNPVTEALIGKPVGETVSIDAELAEGKHIRTSLEILGLRQVVLPPVDDDLAKDAGFDDLAALKEDIRGKLTQGRADRRRRFVEMKLLDTLVEKIEIPLPDPFVMELVDEEIGRIKESFDRPRSSLTFADYLKQRQTTEDDLRKEIRESAELRLRRELILNQLADAEKIAVGEDELEAMAQKDAEEAGEDPLRFVARLKAEERWGEYHSSKLNERLFAVLREHAVVTEKEE